MNLIFNPACVINPPLAPTFTVGRLSLSVLRSVITFNEKLNNKEAQESTDFKYVALVPATTIPVGEDIAEYINNQLKDSDKEQAFALEAGKSYVLNGIVDFRLPSVFIFIL